MRRVLLLLVLTAMLAVPVAATAADAPSPSVVAACQAESAQLGKDAFVAKYGPTEPFGHCYAQHSAVTQPAPVTAPSQDTPAVAACKAEYLSLGSAAFIAKYGATETLGNCVKAQSTPTPAPVSTDSPAVAACKAEYLAVGSAAFTAKYGVTETLGNCVKAHTTPTPPVEKPKELSANDAAAGVCQSLVKSLGKDAFSARFGPKEAMGSCLKTALAAAKACKASSGSSRDAFRACIAAAAQSKRR
jgi:hypothetical protein